MKLQIFPLRVVTRAQTRNNERGTEETGVSPRENEAVPKEKAIPKRRQRRPRSRKSQSKKSAESAKPSVESIVEKLRPEVMGQPTPNKADDRPILEVSSGGSILVEKVNEHLDAIRMAHESCLAAQMEIPKKLQEYPNPLEEKVNLAVHMQMIRETQAILEGRPKLAHPRTNFS